MCTKSTKFRKSDRIFADITLQDLKNPINIFPLLDISDILELTESVMAVGERVVFFGNLQESAGGNQRIYGLDQILKVMEQGGEKGFVGGQVGKGLDLEEN
jgi:hypothetical protein